MGRTHNQATSSITEKVTENNVTQKYIAELSRKIKHYRDLEIIQDSQKLIGWLLIVFFDFV